MIRLKHYCTTIIAILAVCILSGCAALNGTTPTSANGGELQAKVTIGSCIFKTADKNESSLIDAIVPSIVTKGLDYIGTALRKAGESNRNEIIRQVNFEQNTKSFPACIQVVVGSLAQTAASFKPGKMTVGKYESATVDTRLQTTGIFLTDTPKLFVEMRILPSEDGSALSISPTVVDYRPFGDLDNKAIAIALSFHAPGVAYDAKKATSTAIVLGKFTEAQQHVYLPSGTEKIESWEPSIESPWFPAYSGTVKAGSNSKTFPMTLTAVVTETADENKFLLALADVFDGAKPTLQAELELALLKSKQEAAELTQITAETANLTKYYTTQAAAETAIVKYCNSSETGDTTDAKNNRRDNSLAAKLAQLNANLAAIPAGLPAPYPIQLNVSDAAVPEPCP